MGPCGPGPTPNRVSVLMDAVTGGGGGACCPVRSIHLLFSLQALFTIASISSTTSIISFLFRVSFILHAIAVIARSTQSCGSAGVAVSIGFSKVFKILA